MPKNKTQGLIFGVVMSYMMALGMEIYNSAIQQGVPLQPGGFTNLTYAVVGAALRETLFMGFVALAVSELWGNRLGGKLAARLCDPSRDSPFFCRLVRQGCTVLVMCPSMSLLATLFFTIIMGGVPLLELPVKWLGTVMKNIPMAFFWNMFAAGPFTHGLCRRLFG